MSTVPIIRTIYMILKSLLNSGEFFFRKLFPYFHPTRYKPFRYIFLKSINLIRPVIIKTVYGFSLKIPRNDYSFYTYFLWRYKKYEPEVSSLAIDLLKPCDIAIDIGANIGYYSCLFSKCVGKGGIVYSFEPEKNNYIRLRKNLETNGFKWAKSINKAVSDVSGIRHIYLSKENKGDHTLVKIDNRETETVQSLSLDEFIKMEKLYKLIKLIKIDVQGFEYKVFKGMLNCLKNGIAENIIFEYTPHRILMSGDNPRDLLGLIRKSKYSISIVSSTQGDRYSEISDIYNDVDILMNNEFAAFDILLTSIKSKSYNKI